jgi:stage II sporulation protein AA (anti-sigma F factor antagonist)
MIVGEKQIETFLVLGLQGRLDTSQAAEVEKKILEILDKGHDRIILDCQELDYISSSGLRVFLIAQKKMMEKSGVLKICSLQPNIKEIFDISGFSMIFSIFPNLESALNT